MKKDKKAKENKKLKKIGLSILSIPTLFILMFLIGETIGGDITGIGHLFQIIPLIILGLIAYKFPFIGGIFLTVIGATLLALYTILTGLQFPIVDVLIFLPIIASGIILIISSRPK